jgi:pentose-5-phosphate-3-epimerase
MAEIIPAILPKSYEELTEKLELCAGHAPTVQIDICDGFFVQSRTWPYLKGVVTAEGEPVDQIFASIIDQESALPHWEEVDFEFDIMARKVHEKIPDFIAAGASRIVVHKASVDAEELAAILRDFGKRSEEVGMFDIELGLALLPGDSADSIKDIAGQIHFVQVMGIERVGFQGQAFDARAIELVRALKTTYPELPVSVDGGVSLDTAAALVDAGADRLVVGSALFDSGDFLAMLEELKAL